MKKYVLKDVYKLYIMVHGLRFGQNFLHNILEKIKNLATKNSFTKRSISAVF